MLIQCWSREALMISLLISLEEGQILNWHQQIISFKAGRTLMIAAAENLAQHCTSVIIIPVFIQ